MKTVVDTLEPTRVRLAVEVPFDELRPSLDEAYRRIAAQVVVPGFRKGKVPPRIIDQRIGRAAVLEEAVNESLPRWYAQAMQENALQPLGQPEVEVTALEEGQQLAFTAEVDVRPTIELPDYRGIPVQVADADPSEADVEQQLEALRERFGTLTGVDRAAGDGDFVVLDLVASQDGEPVEGGEVSGQTYRVGTGGMVDGLDRAVTGLSEGETATFTTTLAGGPAGGQEAAVEVTVRGVREQSLPDLDDDFAQLASEFDTLDELRADLRERLVGALRIQQAAEARDKVLAELLSRVDVPLPERVVAAQVEEHFSEQHGEQGHRAEVEAEARTSFVRQIVLDEIARAEALEVTQDDLTTYLVQQAAGAGMEPQELADRVVQGGNLPMVAADVVRSKALALVVEEAAVTDASGRPVELKRLREDGTIATAEEVAAEDAAAAAAIAETDAAIAAADVAPDEPAVVAPS